VVNQSLVLRINICGENRQLLVAAKRCASFCRDSLPLTKNFLATTYTDLDTFNIIKATIFESLNNNKIK